MSSQKENIVDRRLFLKGVVLGGLAGTAGVALGVDLSGKKQPPSQESEISPERRKEESYPSREHEVIVERSARLRNEGLAEFIHYDQLANDLTSTWGIDLFPDVTNAINQAANSTIESSKESTFADGWQEVTDNQVMLQRAKNIANAIPITGQGNLEDVRIFLGKVADNYPVLLIASEGYDIHLNPEHRAPGEVDIEKKDYF